MDTAINMQRLESTQTLASNRSSSHSDSAASFDLDDLLEWSSKNGDLPKLQVASANSRIDEYFMGVAILISKKRKHSKHQAGACIVNQMNNIVGIGHYTHTEPLKDELLSWFKDKSKPKYDYLNHAELNAISNKKESNLENCTMYVTSFPCIECAKMIAQSGIAKIVYIEDKCCQTLNENEMFAARLLFELAGVSLVKFR